MDSAAVVKNGKSVVDKPLGPTNRWHLSFSIAITRGKIAYVVGSAFTNVAPTANLTLPT